MIVLILHAALFVEPFFNLFKAVGPDVKVNRSGRKLSFSVLRKTGETRI